MGPQQDEKNLSGMYLEGKRARGMLRVRLGCGASARVWGGAKFQNYEHEI